MKKISNTKRIEDKDEKDNEDIKSKPDNSDISVHKYKVQELLM